MIELRRAVAADAMEIARVHVRAWQVGYRGLLPGDYLRSLRPEDRAARYRFDEAAGGPTLVVALDDGVISGFASCGPSRDADAAGLGELWALYVDPGAWRRGVGRALMEDARARLAEHCSAAVLWMLAGNERARAFYLADGWEPDGSVRSGEHWGLTVDELRLRRLVP